MLPEGWQSKTILELGNGIAGTVQTGPFGSQLHAEDYVDDGIPMLLIRNIGQNGLILDNLPLISVEDAQRLQRYSLKAGDVVFSRVGRVGSCFLVTEQQEGWIISGQTLRIRLPYDQLDPRYFYYALIDRSSQTFISGESVGTTRTSINTNILESLPIRFPDIAEQRKIAHILTTLDAVIERTQALIAKYEAIKQGLLHDLLTRGVDAQGRLRPSPADAPQLYRQSPLGWVPKEWEVVPVADLFEARLGKMLSKASKTGQYSYPYLANRNVQWDYVDVSDVEEMDFLETERSKYRLEHGDLLVCEGGEVGRTAIWRGEIEECYFQKAIHRLRPKGGVILPAFMLRFMRFAANVGLFTNFTSQTSIAHLTGEKLAVLPVSLPPVKEQEAITAMIDSVDRRIQSEQEYQRKLNTLKAGLMQDLLTGRVRVANIERQTTNV